MHIWISESEREKTEHGQDIGPSEQFRIVIDVISSLWVDRYRLKEGVWYHSCIQLWSQTLNCSCIIDDSFSCVIWICGWIDWVEGISTHHNVCASENCGSSLVVITKNGSRESRFVTGNTNHQYYLNKLLMHGKAMSKPWAHNMYISYLWSISLRLSCPTHHHQHKTTTRRSSRRQ